MQSSPSSMTSPAPLIAEADRARYYGAALRVLRHVERRSPTTRRFGSEADARWGAFRGSLTTADRIDLLLRDADAHWPGSFGARHVFALRSAAEDEPFGAEWTPLDPVDAEDLWRTVQTEPVPQSPRDAILAAATTWGLHLDSLPLDPIAPTDKLVIAGPSALLAALVAFEAGTDLDWADQVVVIATPPAHRQLAGLALALRSSTKPGTLVSAAEPATLTAGRRLVLSADASPDDAARAQHLAGAAS